MRKVDFSEFRQQFFGAQEDFHVIDGQKFHVFGVNVGVCHSIPVVNVHDDSGQLVAVLLGYAVLGNKLFCNGEAVVITKPSQILEWRHKLVGRFIIIEYSTGVPRLYLDASGGYGVVFSPGRRAFSSTTSVLFCSENESNISPLAEVLKIPETDSWFPFGFTVRIDAQRLLPHHYLDLENFQPRRFRHLNSKKLADQRKISCPSEIIGNIKQSIEQCIDAVTSQHQTALALTAGRDSRMLVAASTAAAVKPVTYTSEIPDKSAYTDVIVAERIARILKMQHVSLKNIVARQEVLDAWQKRVGHCVAGRTWRESGSGKEFYKEKILLAGIGAEVGRSHFWRRKDFGRSFDKPTEFLRRLGLPSHTQFEQAAHQWLAQFSGQDWLDVLDFAHIELRLGGWAGPSLYGNVDCIFRLSPYNSEYIFDLFLMLPHEYRFEQKLFDEFMSSYSLPILNIPINKAREIDEIRFLFRHPRTFWRMSRRLVLNRFLRIGGRGVRPLKCVGRGPQVEQQ